MRILVPVKRLVDFRAKIRVKADGSGVELSNVKMSMDPFDEIAAEEAPIFQVADYGLVGDLFAILPAFDAELAEGGTMRLSRRHRANGAATLETISATRPLQEAA